jgi:hypothetical protein
MGSSYQWITTTTEPDSNNKSHDYDWGNAANWISYGDAPAPTAGDFVYILGHWNGFDTTEFAYVTGGGSADVMFIDGPVVFEGNFNAGDGSQNPDLLDDPEYVAGAGVVIEYGASFSVIGTLNVAGGVEFMNGYIDGSASSESLSLSGTMNVLGALATSYDTYISVDLGTMTVGSVNADGIFGNVQEATLSLTVSGFGSFVDNGALQSDSLSIDVSGLGSATIDGVVTIGLGSEIVATSEGDVSIPVGGDLNIVAEDLGSVVLGSLASANYSTFNVDSEGASIAVNASSGEGGGTFLLGGALVTSGDITAPQIVINGPLEVASDSKEELSGQLSGSGSLLIDAGATLGLADAPANDSGNTIVFNGVGGTLELGDAVVQSGTFAPHIAGLAAGDLIQLDGFSDAQIVGETETGNGALLVTLAGNADGEEVTFQLTFDGGKLGDV